MEKLKEEIYTEIEEKNSQWYETGWKNDIVTKKQEKVKVDGDELVKINIQELEPREVKTASEEKYRTFMMLFRPKNKDWDKKIESFIIAGECNKESNFANEIYCFKFASFLIEAYNLHGDILLRPEDIWIAILQGLCVHINNNSEQLRDLFVDFTGKKELVVDCPDMPNEIDWNKQLDMITNLIKANTKKDIVEKFECNFSKSTDFDKLISRMGIMASLKNYFEYTFCSCGFRNVYFSGSLDDWLNLRKKVEFIERFDCKWWVDKLLRMINEFISSYQGKVNVDFWNKVCVMQDGYESDFVAKNDLSGWILNFYPYEDDGKKMNASIPKYNLPHQTFEVPINYILPFGQKLVLSLLSGFTGINYKDGIFSPQLSYILTYEAVTHGKYYELLYKEQYGDTYLEEMEEMEEIEEMEEFEEMEEMEKCKK